MLALALGAGIARAQDVADEEPSGPVLAPAIADGRLASIDDGIDEVFAAWASERFYAGTLNAGVVPGATMQDPGGATSLAQASSLMLLTEIGARFGLTRDTRVRADWGLAYTHSRVSGTYMDTATSMMSYDATSDHVSTRNPV